MFFIHKGVETTIKRLISNDKAFNAFVVGQTISQIGENMSKVSLAWVAMALMPEHIAMALGLLAVTQALPPLLFGWSYGHVIDSPPQYISAIAHRRHLLFWADLCRGLLFAMFPLLYAMGHLTPFVFYTIAFLAAIFSGLFGPAMFATLPGFGNQAGSFVQRNATINITGHIGALTGPIIGGLVALWGRPADGLYVTAATFLASAFVIRRISAQYPLESFWRWVGHNLRELVSNGSPIKGTFYALYHCPGGRAYALMSMLVGLALGPIITILPAYVKGPLHGTPLIFGCVIGAASLGMMLANAGLHRLPLFSGEAMSGEARGEALSRPEIFLSTTLFVSGLLVIPLGIVHGFLILAGMTLIAAGLADTFNPVIQTEIQSAVPDLSVGRVLASLGAFFLIGFNAGSLLTPWLVDTYGYFAAFSFAGVMRVLAAFIPLFFLTHACYIKDGALKS